MMFIRWEHIAVAVNIFCELMKKQNRGRDDHCLPEDGGQDGNSRAGTETPSVRQQVFRKFQKVYSKKWDDSQISTPQLPSTKHGQTLNSDIQEPFCVNFQWS